MSDECVLYLDGRRIKLILGGWEIIPILDKEVWVNVGVDLLIYSDGKREYFVRVFNKRSWRYYVIRVEVSEPGKFGSVDVQRGEFGDFIRESWWRRVGGVFA